MKNRKTPHELVAFLAVHAVRYSEDYKLDGLHPVHYDLMQKYGCRMDSFKRADVPASKPVFPPNSREGEELGATASEEKAT